MPELPEVETVRRGLEPVMQGQRIVKVEQRRKDLRFPFPPRFVERLTGARVLGLARRAKYLVVEIEGETPGAEPIGLIMHLGMSGRFIIEAPDGAMQAPGEFASEVTRHVAHDHVVFHMSSGTRITYNDVRRFGFMDLVPMAEMAASKHFAAMGIEPLGNALSGETLAALFDGKVAPLKAALLDQRLVAGLGNIYVCEALFRAGLHPEAEAGSIADKAGRPKPKAHELAQIIRDVLNEAIEAGGSTLRDFAHADGSLGYFQHRFRVYDREGEACVTPACQATVQRIVQSGRSTFYCPSCQKRR
ncbi:MAG: bifunctional DNA-formamidopyrimidine glycosylase/DNA-(apurinic or apyrimidinic site) lyase [Bosea sp. (in: a-proteobacteria)]